jgi:Rrf2 family iron-responsive transcriptional regulator
MLITREADYAIRLIRGLTDGEIHPVKSLCETEEIPWKFAYKILKKLKDAGIVESLSGVHGGCRLRKDLNDVTLLDLLTAVEGRQYINDCMKPGYECAWERRNNRKCEVCRQLAGIQKRFDRELEGYTLMQLIEGGGAETQV